jgi:protein gp37
MADRSKIEWTDATWNPIRGCTRVSAGCDNCYAIGVAHRYPWGRGLTRIRGKGESATVDWSGEISVLNRKLPEPLHWRKARRVFVCSGADLFHHNVPYSFLACVFAVMAAAPQHRFQLLTKRPERALDFLRWLERGGMADSPFDPARSLGGVPEALHHYADAVLPKYADRIREALWPPFTWPLPNVWMGVSAEDQPAWEARVPVLARIPAAIRFVSAEPLLGPIDLELDDLDYRAEDGRTIDWLIAGAESGPAARPMDEDWIRGLRDECRLLGVPFFYKQRLEDGRKVGLPELDGQIWDQLPSEAP